MIEFVLLAVGAIVGAFLRYAMVASPKTLAGLPVNVLVVNVVGSFTTWTFLSFVNCSELGFELFFVCCHGVLRGFHNHVVLCVGDQQPHG